MEVTILAALVMVLSRDMACTFGQMALDTLGSGSQMKCRAKVFSSGLMAVILRVNLNRVSCMASGFTPGRMVVAMKVITATIRSTAKGFTRTVMAANITANGLMGFSMGSVAL